MNERTVELLFKPQMSQAKMHKLLGWDADQRGRK